MNKKELRFGIIGLGLMGKEIASAMAQSRRLTDENLPVPVIKSIRNREDEKSTKWFREHDAPGLDLRIHR